MKSLNKVLHQWESFAEIGYDLLKPISNEADYDHAIAFLDEITDRMESPNDVRYLGLVQLLAQNISTWEEAHFNIPDSSPSEMLEFLMTQHKLKASDLKDLVDQSALSKILRGQRSISKQLAKAFAEKFRVPVGVFL
jgi:HTH-type transcriptional regulator / antitoxin HigA